MKNSFLLTLQLILVGVSNAQLTASDVNPIAGDTFHIQTCSYIGLGNAGNNVVWDFSGVSSIDGPALVSYTHGFPTLPNSNITSIQTIVDNPNVQPITRILHVNSTAQEYLGSPDVTYSDSEKLLEFPIDLSMNFTDDFAASFVTAGNNFDKTGNSTITCDGFGTLITPEGTYTDVYRTHLVQSSSDVSTSGGINSQYTTDEYNWYKAGYHHPIMTLGTYSFVLSPIDITENRAKYLVENNSVSEITDLDVSEISIYPNPAQETIHLETKHIIKSVDLISLNGKKIRSIQVNSNTPTISISNLKAGTYILRIETKSGKISYQKFLKM